MDNIRTAVKCFHCLKQLKSPVLLPCGQSICKEHVDKPATTIACIQCEKGHEIPANIGFPANKGLELIINAQIDQLNLGQVHLDAQQACDQLRDAIGSLEALVENPESYICEQIDDLKRRVDLKCGQLHEAIDDEADKVIRSLKKCQRDLVADLKASQAIKERQVVLKRVLVNEKVSLEACAAALKQLNIDDETRKSLRSTCEKSKKPYESCIFSFKNKVFSNYETMRGLVRKFERIKFNKIG